MYYLFIISMVIQMITLLWVVVLHKRIGQLQNVRKDSEKIQRETEDIFMSFMVEMKEENENFLKKMKNTSNVEYKEQKQEILPTYERFIDVKEDSVEYKEFLPPLVAEEESPIEETTKEEVGVEPMLDEIAEEAERLLQEGHTIEEIAKRLHKGKTEIELLMKFRQSYMK